MMLGTVSLVIFLTMASLVDCSEVLSKIAINDSRTCFIGLGLESLNRAIYISNTAIHVDSEQTKRLVPSQCEITAESRNELTALQEAAVWVCVVDAAANVSRRQRHRRTTFLEEC